MADTRDSKSLAHKAWGFKSLQRHHFNMKKLLSIILLTLLTNIGYSASVELEWKMKDDSNVVEYSLTMWTESGLAVTTKLGNIKSVRIDTLSHGKTYLFQITPLSKSGSSGTPSDVIIYKVPPIRTEDVNGKPQLKIKK